MAKKLKITQIKSGIGYRQRTKDTLRALGFRRMQQTVEHNDSPAIRGMIKAVRHLVKVDES
ncbi:MAG: 50S ribosomal protein L30 [Candidatus Marinimicrobia bacterium]|nr:50S ribosomal protein L30 [Candidatus Neomarinimicrobiota bacterium]